jgi:anthranilate synthase component 1
MTITTEREQFLKLATTFPYVVVATEFANDILTPMQVCLALHEHLTGMTLFESAYEETHQAHYSFLAFNPIAEIKTHAHELILTDHGAIAAQQPFSLDHLRALFARYQTGMQTTLPGFIGGFAGFVGFGVCALLEKKCAVAMKDSDYPAIFFRFYQHHIIFDHAKNRLYLATVVNTQNQPEQLSQRYDNAITYLNQLFDDIHHNVAKINPLTHATKETINTSDVNVSPNDQEYEAIVEQAKLHIREGDIFQMVPSREFSINTNAHPLAIYRRLRQMNPSPYLFYIDCNDSVIMGASPEKFISVTNNHIETCPLAGTRQRKEPARDQEIADELLNNEKECAEHMMLVDLARNDLGRVAQAGTVRVTKLKAIKTCPKVLHIASTVVAELKPELDSLDAFFAAFPAGTVSGAPKIRAIELINEYETTPRGIYGGAIGYINSHGDLDSCLAIRMLTLKEGKAIVRAGAGIVFDSIPTDEANETRHKAKALLETLIVSVEDHSL